MTDLLLEVDKTLAQLARPVALLPGPIWRRDSPGVPAVNNILSVHGFYKRMSVQEPFQ